SFPGLCAGYRPASSVTARAARYDPDPMARRLRIPSMTLHKATGQAVVRLAGKDHYLGTFGTDEARERYDRLIAEWLASGRRLPQTTPAKRSVAELARDFLRHAQTYYPT